MKRRFALALVLAITIGIPALAQPTRDQDGGSFDRLIKKVIRLLKPIAHPSEDYPTPPKP